VLMWRVRDKLNPPTAPNTSLETITTLRDQDQTLAPLRFLFVPYLPRFYFWEVIELYRRIAFIGLLPLLSTHVDRRAAIGILLAIVSVAVYGELEPFQRRSTDILARSAQYSIFLTFGCGEMCSCFL
jgi:hypothetical protein